MYPLVIPTSYLHVTCMASIITSSLNRGDVVMSLLAVVCTFIILSLVVAALILPMLKNDCCPLYDQAVLTVDDLGLDCSIEK